MLGSSGADLSFEVGDGRCVRGCELQVPRLIKVLDTIPRNAMGKVNKKELVKVFSE